MATKTNNNKERVRSAEILEETPTAKDRKENPEAKSKTERALLAPRYLVPTFRKDSETARSKTKLAAVAAVGLVLAALLALYIYGATLA